MRRPLVALMTVLVVAASLAGCGSGRREASPCDQPDVVGTPFLTQKSEPRAEAWLVADYAAATAAFNEAAARAAALGATSVTSFDGGAGAEGPGSWVVTWASRSKFDRGARRVADAMLAAGATGLRTCPKLA